MRVIFFNLLKTNVEKMSTLRLSTMLMKTHELSHSLHDVDEKKGSYKFSRKSQEAPRQAQLAFLGGS